MKVSRSEPAPAIFLGFWWQLTMSWFSLPQLPWGSKNDWQKIAKVIHFFAPLWQESRGRIPFSLSHWANLGWVLSPGNNNMCRLAVFPWFDSFNLLPASGYNDPWVRPRTYLRTWLTLNVLGWFKRKMATWKHEGPGNGVTAQHLRILTVLAEDPGSDSSTHMVTPDSQSASAFGHPAPFSGLLTINELMCTYP